MTCFIKYILTPGQRRAALVKSFDAPYSQVKDPYWRARRAIQAGRRTGQDEQAMQGAIQNCRPQMRGHYVEIARGWLAFIERRKDTTLVTAGTARWHTSDVTIKVTPDLVLLHPDGSADATKLYLSSDPVSTQAAGAMLWLMQQTLDQCHPGARPMILDVRRRKAHTTVQPRTEYESWLESEAASLAFLHRRRRAA